MKTAKIPFLHKLHNTYKNFILTVYKLMDLRLNESQAYFTNTNSFASYYFQLIGYRFLFSGTQTLIKIIKIPFVVKYIRMSVFQSFHSIFFFFFIFSFKTKIFAWNYFRGDMKKVFVLLYKLYDQFILLENLKIPFPLFPKYFVFKQKSELFRSFAIDFLN